MNKKAIKKAIGGLLQYGWMWGYPRHIERDGWKALHDFYKAELNGGKDFEPDKTKKATT